MIDLVLWSFALTLLPLIAGAISALIRILAAAPTRGSRREMDARF